MSKHKLVEKFLKAAGLQQEDEPLTPQSYITTVSDPEWIKKLLKTIYYHQYDLQDSAALFVALAELPSHFELILKTQKFYAHDAPIQLQLTVKGEQWPDGASVNLLPNDIKLVQLSVAPDSRPIFKMHLKTRTLP